MPENFYRVSDLANCRVVTEFGEVLGILADVYPTKGNDVWIVRSEKREYLIPALKSVILKVDLETHQIMVRLPEGLRQIYES